MTSDCRILGDKWFRGGEDSKTQKYQDWRYPSHTNEKKIKTPQIYKLILKLIFK